MTEANPQSELELAKLESWRDTVLAGREVEREPSIFKFDDAVRWFLYTGDEAEADILAQVGTFRRPSDLPTPAHFFITAGALTNDDDLVNRGTSIARREILDEKLENAVERDWGYSLKVHGEEALVQSLVIAGLTDILDDFAGTRGHHTPRVTVPARLWSAHLKGDLETFAALAPETMTLGNKRYMSHYYFTIRELADLLAPLGLYDAIKHDAKHSAFESGEAAIITFDFLNRFHVPGNGFLTFDQVYEELLHFRDERFFSQFDEAITAAGNMVDDPFAAYEHFEHTIQELDEGYEDDLRGYDINERRSHLRTLMVQTLMLTGQTQLAYDLAEIPILPWFAGHEDVQAEDLVEETQHDRKQRTGWVLLHSLERSRDIDFDQLDEMLKIKGSEEEIDLRMPGYKPIISEDPTQLRILKIIDRAIEQRTPPTQSAN